MSHISPDESSSPSHPPATGAAVRLTPRQQEVFDVLLGPQSPKQIAASLRLKLDTVYKYSQAIFRKYGVSDRYELMAKCLRNETKP